MLIPQPRCGTLRELSKEETHHRGAFLLKNEFRCIVSYKRYYQRTLAPRGTHPRLLWIIIVDQCNPALLSSFDNTHHSTKLCYGT
jgi:hypothetical protein